MEIAKESITSNKKNSTRTLSYKMWKQSLHKWDEYIYNRHRVNKYIDKWSQKCLNELQGKAAVYNSGGMFFKDFNRNIVVIEHDPCPIDVSGMIYLENKFDRFNNEFETLIMVNPIALKYHGNIWDFLTKPGQSRAGFKGNVLHWLTSQSTIFLSFSDWHMYYDRLKYCPKDFINLQLENLEQQGITCSYKEICSSDHDIVNGNVKLKLKICKTNVRNLAF